MPRKKSKSPPPLTLMDALSVLPDPRSTRSQKHPLLNIVVIAVCGVLSGADNWVAIEDWAKARKDWLEGFLNLDNGVPSHDTLGRVFSILSPSAFQAAFASWAERWAPNVDGRVIAVDGKTLRRSHDRSRNRKPLHLVSAWCTDVGVALGQVATEEKSNENTAIPELLEMLTLRGAIVTIDAMGCQTRIAQVIREREGDYLLALKYNQPLLAAAVAGTFDDALAAEALPESLLTATQEGRGHGREEARTVWVLPAPPDLPRANEWQDLRSIVMVENSRTVGTRTSVDHRFYISSLQPADPATFLHATRAHWGIENGLHWVLDVAFREDESRVRLGHAAENLSRLRQIALNLLKRDKTSKGGIQTRRLRAGWDTQYLEKLLTLAAEGLNA